MSTCDKNGKDNNYSKLVIRSIEIKKAKNIMFWFLKKAYERRKIRCSSGFCRISNFIGMKGVFYVSKKRWDVLYLENCASRCLAQQPHKRIVETRFKLVDTFSACFNLVRVVVNHRYVYGREIAKKFLSTLLLIDVYIFLHVTLFKMHLEMQLERKNLIL